MVSLVKSSDSRTPCILIADDQPDVLEALRFLVKGEGYSAEAVNSPAAAIDAVESRDFDAVLMDLNYARDTTSGQEGLDLLNHLRALDSTLPIVVMTAWGSIDLAVEAMQRGVEREDAPLPVEELELGGHAASVPGGGLRVAVSAIALIGLTAVTLLVRRPPPTRSDLPTSAPAPPGR